jgi:hypothetical protein
MRSAAFVARARSLVLFLLYKISHHESVRKQIKQKIKKSLIILCILRFSRFTCRVVAYIYDKLIHKCNQPFKKNFVFII